MTLHATAKAFVPSAAAKEFVPSSATPKATTAGSSWGPSKSKSEKSSGGGKKSAPAKNGDNVAKAAAKEAPKAPTPAPAPKVAAWGSKPLDAIKKAVPIMPQPKQAVPKQEPHQERSNSGRSSTTNNKGGDWKRGEKSKPSAGGSNAGSWARAAAKPGVTNNKDDDNRRQSQSRGGKGGEDGGNEDKSWSRGKVLPTELLVPGEGSSDVEKAVKRISVFDILSIRLDNLAASSSWEPPEACHWNSPTREAEIEEIARADRIGGDVSKQERRKKQNPNDTAPALEDCKPLQVDDETRWKAKVFEGKEVETDEGAEAESKEEILRRALLILNKLSLTKFDKLSDAFINCGIGRDIDCLTGAVGMIVNKAQEEQHFASMYAGLCLKMANTPMEGIDEGTKKRKKVQEDFT